MPSYINLIIHQMFYGVSRAVWKYLGPTRCRYAFDNLEPITQIKHALAKSLSLSDLQTVWFDAGKYAIRNRFDLKLLK